MESMFGEKLKYKTKQKNYNQIEKSIMYALWDNPDIKFHVCTTRFNNETLLENKLSRIRLQKKALYCSLRPIKDTYREDYLFILELNNDKSKRV